MSEEIVLPEGWAIARLQDIAHMGEVCNPKAGRDEKFLYVDIKAVDNTKQKIVRPKSLPNSQAPSRARMSIKTGDVIFSLVRPYLKNIAIVPAELDSQVASTAFCVLRPEAQISSNYIFYALLRNSFISSIPTYGNSPPAARDEEFWAMSIPLAAVAEQQRIVEAIEQQISCIDAGVMQLQQAQKKLKQYRYSILKAAVEGELTSEWRRINSEVEPASELLKRILVVRRAKWEEEQRAKGKDPSKLKYIEPVGPDVDSLPQLPSGWCWATIGQITECLDHKRVPINKQERTKRVGTIPYYGANGQVGWINDYIFNEPLVLVVEDETFLGRERPFSYKIVGKTWVNNHAHVLRSTFAVLVDYLNYSLAHYNFTPLTRGTTGRRKLNRRALMIAPYALAPLSEQEQIVSLIEERLSILSELESAVERALKRAQKERQSIFHLAFTGKLVPQDPNDEPASVLLESIRKKREQLKRKDERKVTPARKAPKTVRTVQVTGQPPGLIDGLEATQDSLWRNVESKQKNV